ncbi:MAG: recombination protein NinB [Rhodospirillaceae bacterium]|nr:recombination protein NinB [Rhodospirillaceae bacterium]
MTTIILRGETQVAFAIESIHRLNKEKLWEVIIRPYRKPRTLDQNALIHSWFGLIASETGNDPDDVKEALKAKFLPARLVDIDGESIEVRRSTAKLNTVEMAEFCNRMQAWAASELGIQLPTRDDMREAA